MELAVGVIEGEGVSRWSGLVVVKVVVSVEVSVGWKVEVELAVGVIEGEGVSELVGV
ncbi:MAG: hypothetical protein IPI28_09850 [Candidatus Omnitrophica bacterium]|nr:hypothetical protein [Candidatus Omnitrophota bacterium]